MQSNGVNFDKFKHGELHENNAVTTLERKTISAFA
jgi:hypothetical protein